jgi:hypothetical protein
MSNKYPSSSRLFTNPSFAKGTARIGDIFGTLDEYNYEHTEEEAGTKALAKDWSLVGNDIDQAITIYGAAKESNTSK